MAQCPSRNFGLGLARNGVPNRNAQEALTALRMPKGCETAPSVLVVQHANNVAGDTTSAIESHWGTTRPPNLVALQTLIEGLGLSQRVANERSNPDKIRVGSEEFEGTLRSRALSYFSLLTSDVLSLSLRRRFINSGDHNGSQRYFIVRADR